MNILITGVAGFIGSNLAARLLREGHTIWGLDNFSYGNYNNIRPLIRHAKFRFFANNFAMPMDGVVPAGADIIVHLASFKIPRYDNALRTLDENSAMLKNAILYCRTNGSRLIFPSTSEIYGKNVNAPFAEDADLVMGETSIKRWAYAISKMYSEQYIQACHTQYGVDYTIMRFFNAYGINNNTTWWGGPVSLFIKSIADGTPIELHGDGTQMRCFTFVDDTIDGIVRCMFRLEAKNEIFNIGNPNTEMRVIDLAYLIGELMNKEVKINYAPYSTFGKYEDVMRRIPDISKAQHLLDFNPSIGLREGLSRTIAWQLAKK